MRFFFLAVALATAACSNDHDDAFASAPARAEETPDAGGAPPQGAEAGALPSTCDAQCRQISLTVRKGDVTVAFDGAQFGFEYAAHPQLKLSVTQGGDASCPASAQPGHAIQITGLPAPLDGTSLETITGLTGTLFDFHGDLLASRTTLVATRVAATPTAAWLDPASGEAFIAFDLRLEFEQGIVAEGHVYAAHCPSNDGK